jgi:predicted RNase H-like HicB family nuclease
VENEMIAYAVAIEPGTDTAAWGTAVPDLPGCFSAGDTLEEALQNTQQAAEAWIDAVVEDGSQIPAPRPMVEHYADPEYAGWTWALIQIDPARLDNTAERVNITLPRRILARLDAYAESTGKSRSGAIADLTLHAEV